MFLGSEQTLLRRAHRLGQRHVDLAVEDLVQARDHHWGQHA
jgi:hypothetical protein